MLWLVVSPVASPRFLPRSALRAEKTNPQPPPEKYPIQLGQRKEAASWEHAAQSLREQLPPFRRTRPGPHRSQAEPCLREELLPGTDHDQVTADLAKTCLKMTNDLKTV